MSIPCPPVCIGREPKDGYLYLNCLQYLGYIYTKLTAAFLDPQPDLGQKWADSNPLGRLGRPDELRGVISWLASDVSWSIITNRSLRSSTQPVLFRRAHSARAASMLLSFLQGRLTDRILSILVSGGHHAW